jgi:hypothetical protein
LKQLSEEQRANARLNSAREAKERHKRQTPDFDWDGAIIRLRAMLDALDYDEEDWLADGLEGE